ncbi:MAG: glycosyltransferase family 39 protein, partial [Planctomycetes bacterium]|nr:glycosyltransferase family 39 protein [Planctomycetota bacterium]
FAAFSGRHASGLGAALAVTVVALWASPPQMRMQFDETSLCGTAQNMHLHRTAMMGTAAVPTDDGLLFTDWNLDKRPPLFSFLVSIVHDVTGYRIANAFAVNGACLFLLLAFLAVVARDWIGSMAAVAAPILAAAVPLLIAAGTSAGFELLATLLLAVFVTAAIEFAAAPSPHRFSWLLANGLCYATSRYESLFVFGLVLGLVWWQVRRIRPGRFGWLLLAATPVLLLPIALLLWHASDPGFYLEAAGAQLVSLRNAGAHLGPLAEAWLLPPLLNVFPGLIGIASMAVLAIRLGRRRGTFADVLVIVPVLALTVIALLWFYGDVREATAQRLYLPAAVLDAIGVLPLLAMNRSKLIAAFVIVAAAVLTAWRLHAVHRGELLPQHRVARLLDQVDMTLAQLPFDRDRTVWVTTLSQYLIIHGRAAMPPRAFASRQDAVAAGVDVLVLTSPLDELLSGWFGDPQQLLRTQAAEELGRAVDPDSDAAIVIYRLRR